MIGEVLGSYRIIGKIGEGGMGVVYKAEHTMLGKHAAVKLLLPELSKNEEIVQRFFNEAKAVAMIDHPGLVTVFDFGYHENGSAFIVMEFLHGESLAERIKNTPIQETEFIVEFARQVTHALQAAHDQQIVHRDLKPDNLFLCPDAAVPGGIRAKVLDFGIAKLAGESSGSVKTRTGSVMGTPIYMSPEQCRGAGAVDKRADVYALGCIFYEMACGKTPFSGEGTGEIIGKHLYETAPPICEVNANAHEGLAAVIEKALQKAPEDRFQTMSAFYDAMEAAAGGAQTTPSFANGASSKTGTVVGTGGNRKNTTGPTGTTFGIASGAVVTKVEGKKSRWGAIGGIALLAAVGGGAALALGGSDGESGKPKVETAQLPSAFDASVPRPLADAAVLLDARPVFDANEPAALVDASVAKGLRRRDTSGDEQKVPMVSVELASQPSGAKVFRERDRKLLGVTPLSFSEVWSASPVVYWLRKPGFKPERLTLSLGQRADHGTISRSSRLKRKKVRRKPFGNPLNPFAKKNR